MHQDRLPLPKGLRDHRTEGTRILVGDHPVVFRAATNIAGGAKIDRAINVGLPCGANYTFDAESARLRYAWKGEFINAGPAWGGRGRNPVTAQGESLFTAPLHFPFPLRIGGASSEPSVSFLGYSLVDKHPIFRYVVDGVEVQERIDIQEMELVRRFTIANSNEPLHFVGDTQRQYKASAGEFKEGVLTIESGKKLDFEVREQLTIGAGIAVENLRWVAAGNEEPPISKNGPSATVVFENKTEQSVKIYWVGYDGQNRLYHRLDAGNSRSQGTYANNTWLITDDDDQPLGHFFVDKPLMSHAVIPSKK